MNRSTGDSPIWLWFTAPTAILLAIAAGGAQFIDGLYRDSPYVVAQVEGQDLVSLVVVLPALIISALLSSRGSPHARLIWLGALVYLVYSYALFAFAVKYNPLFLGYVGLLGCSLYALIAGLATLDKAGIKACATGKTPVKAISIYLVVLAIVFYLMWLSEIVPALVAGKTPQSMLDNGTPTNAVHVLDMAWILPALIITAVSLWRKQPLGYALAGTMLSYLVLLIAAILSMILFMIRTGNPVVAPQVAVFATAFPVSLGMLVWYLRGLKSPHPGGEK